MPSAINHYICTPNTIIMAYIDFTLRLTLGVTDASAIECARRRVARFLNLLSLRCRTCKSFLPIEEPHLHQQSGLGWGITVWILPPEGSIAPYRETLQYLQETAIDEFLSAHPELRLLSMFRNLTDYPGLFPRLPGNTPEELQ